LSIKGYYKCLIICAFVGLASCKSGRDAAGGNKNKLPNIKTSALIDSLQAHDLDCDWMSIKYDVKIKTSKIDDSFKLYVRLKQDSVIWISATYYAVEIGRFLFTPDSVKYIDRRNNKFYAGGYEYITDKFMIEADFSTLQSLILANGSAFVENTQEKLRSSEDEGAYTISFLRKGQLKRAAKKEEFKKPIDLSVSLWVNPKWFRLNKANIRDYNEKRSLTATYSNLEKQCNSMFPKNIEFIAESPNEQATVNTSVIKITTGKKVNVSFTIPDKYEPLVP
jgi:hypothetical protein